MAELIKNPTSKVKFNVFMNRDGNICQEGETPTSQKTCTFGGFASSITADELINTENSPAVHNGVSALMWLFSGRDDNFDENISRTLIEEVDDV